MLTVAALTCRIFVNRVNNSRFKKDLFIYFHNFFSLPYSTSRVQAIPINDIFHFSSCQIRERTDFHYILNKIYVCISKLQRFVCFAGRVFLHESSIERIWGQRPTAFGSVHTSEPTRVSNQVNLELLCFYF